MRKRMRKQFWLGVGQFVVEFALFIGMGILMEIGFEEISLFSAIYFLTMLFYKHYELRPALIWQEIVKMLQAHVLAWAISLIISFYIKNYLFIKMTIIIGVMYCFTILGGRAWRLLTRKKTATRLLVFGAGKCAEEIDFIFNNNRFMYVKPLAYVDLEPLKGEERTNKDELQDMIISIGDVSSFIKENEIDEVFIVDETLSEEHLGFIIKYLHHKVPVVRYKPKMKVVQPYNTEVDDFDGNLFVAVTDAKKKALDVVLKRIIDILAGIAGCLILLPLTVFVKVASLKRGDKESIFFTQNRVGRDGKIIKIYKYRSMVPNAEQVLEEMMAKDPKIREEYLTNKKLDPDPRITPMGDLLRKTSLDEFPQFINVLKGEMSLIGPRPYLPREIEDMGEAYETIIKSKPGITGMWQANGRSEVGFEDRCKLDVYYYDNWSIWLDVIIVVKTIKAVLARKGAK